jgi:methylated-DNA-[protein]-cysteine S-methyltransferase
VLHYEIIETKWGPFVCVTTERGLKATLTPRVGGSPIEQKVAQRWPGAKPGRSCDKRFRSQICDYFNGRPVAFEVVLDLADVTEFRRRVLEACRRIPYGRLASYADLARAAGRPNAMRAAGSAMAHNPLPLIIPCHRVIRSDGTLGGFSSPDGVAMKRRLLQLEGALADLTVGAT